MAALGRGGTRKSCMSHEGNITWPTMNAAAIGAALLPTELDGHLCAVGWAPSATMYAHAYAAYAYACVCMPCLVRTTRRHFHVTLRAFLPTVTSCFSWRFEDKRFVVPRLKAKASVGPHVEPEGHQRAMTPPQKKKKTHTHTQTNKHLCRTYAEPKRNLWSTSAELLERLCGTYAC